MLCISDLLDYATRPNAAVPPPERVLHLRLGRACNMTCAHCYTAQRVSYERLLDVRTATRVIERCARAGFTSVAFGGGEPLFRSDLQHIVRFAKARSLQGALYTNGLLLDRDRVEQLRDAGLCSVEVGVDGRERFHKIYRGHPQAYAGAMRALEVTRTAGLRGGIRMVLGDWNLGELEPMLEEARHLPIEHFSIVLDAGDPQRGGSRNSLSEGTLDNIAECAFSNAARFIRLGHGPKVWITDQGMAQRFVSFVEAHAGRRAAERLRVALATYVPNSIRVVVDYQRRFHLAA